MRVYLHDVLLKFQFLRKSSDRLSVLRKESAELCDVIVKQLTENFIFNTVTIYMFEFSFAIKYWHFMETYLVLCKI